MAKIQHLFFSPSFLLLLLLLATTITNPSEASPVHDMLPKFGLPKGLLPDAVDSYSLSSDGDFVVELRSPCYVSFADLVYYDKTIKGKLSYGSISDLSGIQVKKLFAWLPLTAIIADGAAIEFQVGFLSEKLPTNMFANIPACKTKPGSSCRGIASQLLPLAQDNFQRRGDGFYVHEEVIMHVKDR